MFPIEKVGEYVTFRFSVVDRAGSGPRSISVSKIKTLAQE
jgi:hypothetical protein